MNEHSEDILSVPWRGSTIGLAGCGIWLFFLVILGIRAENRQRDVGILITMGCENRKGKMAGCRNLVLS